MCRTALLAHAILSCRQEPHASNSIGPGLWLPLFVKQKLQGCSGECGMQRRKGAQKHISTQDAHFGQKIDATRSIQELEGRVTRLEKLFESAVAPFDYVADIVPIENRKRP